MGFRHDEATRAEAIRLYRDRHDLEVEDIALRVGASRRSVQTWARAAGVPPRPPKTPEAFDSRTKAKAVRLYLRGEKMWRIEGATGMGEGSIREAVRKAGHTLRSSHTNGRVDTEDALRLAKRLGPAEAARRLECHQTTIQYHVRKARKR